MNNDGGMNNNNIWERWSVHMHAKVNKFLGNANNFYPCYTLTWVSVWTGPVKSNRSCSSTEFPCDNGKCIPLEWKCNKANECGDLSDEKATSCATANGMPCYFNHFLCNKMSPILRGNSPIPWERLLLDIINLVQNYVIFSIWPVMFWYDPVKYRFSAPLDNSWTIRLRPR